MDEMKEKKQRIVKEWVLGLIVSVVSALLAFTAYQGALFDSRESDMNVEGQKLLMDSNYFYLETNAQVIYDQNLYDSYYLAGLEGDTEAQDYYADVFSDELWESMDRPEGPFDDQYYDEMYLDAEGAYDDSEYYFAEAQDAGDIADQLQLVVLIYAVSLALAGYGSIIDEDSKLRNFFATSSLFAFIAGLAVYIMTMFL